MELPSESSGSGQDKLLGEPLDLKVIRPADFVAESEDCDAKPSEVRPALQMLQVQEKPETPKGSPKAKSPSPSPTCGSPEPSCAICLGPLQNKSFLDSCFHSFCFTCLLKWSKIKAECPLCKKKFNSIVHNVRSIEDYDQYHIVSQSSESSWRGSDGRRFRYSSTLTSERLLERWQQSDQTNLNRQSEYQMHRLLYAPHSFNSNTPIAPLATPQAPVCYARQGVYTIGLWSKKPRGKVRCTTPLFYQQNSSCRVRLVPWLNRELSALLHESDSQVMFVLELILALIMRYDIKSKEFFIHLQPYLMANTSHFVHEFYNFASSPDDIAQYDENVSYEWPEDSETIVSSSPESPDVIHILSDTPTQSTSASNSIAAVPSTSSYRKKNKKRIKRTAKLYLKRDQDSRFWNISHSPPSSPHPKDFPMFINRYAGPNVASPSSSVVDIENESSNDCEFLQYIKPKGQRTPELVDLISDAESTAPAPKLSVATVEDVDNVEAIADVDSINNVEVANDSNTSVQVVETVGANTVEATSSFEISKPKMKAKKLYKRRQHESSQNIPRDKHEGWRDSRKNYSWSTSDSEGSNKWTYTSRSVEKKSRRALPRRQIHWSSDCTDGSDSNSDESPVASGKKLKLRSVVTNVVSHRSRSSDNHHSSRAKKHKHKKKKHEKHKHYKSRSHSKDRK